MSTPGRPVVRLAAGFALAALLAAPAAADPQRGPPPGKGPRGDMARDMEVFHFLLENHKDIRRTVKTLKDGVETLTESDRPEVAKKIHQHRDCVVVVDDPVGGARGWGSLQTIAIGAFPDYGLTLGSTFI